MKEKTVEHRRRAERSLRLLKERLEELKKWRDKYREMYDRAEQYYRDSKHYFDREDYFTSFGASDYAYGILDTIEWVEENKG